MEEDNLNDVDGVIDPQCLNEEMAGMPGLNDSEDDEDDEDWLGGVDINILEERRQIEYLFNRPTDLSEEHAKVLDDAMIEAIFKDTIRNIELSHPLITKGSVLKDRLKEMWKAYKNSRMYKGDYLEFSFKNKFTPDLMLNEMLKSLKAKSLRDPEVSVNGFYKSR